MPSSQVASLVASGNAASKDEPRVHATRLRDNTVKRENYKWIVKYPKLLTSYEGDVGNTKKR